MKLCLLPCCVASFLISTRLALAWDLGVGDTCSRHKLLLLDSREVEGARSGLTPYRFQLSP